MDATLTNQQATGTVDLLNGLAAMICSKLQEQGRVDIILVNDWNDVLYQLKETGEWEQELQYVDFQGMGDHFYSQALERYLFMAGALGLHQLYDSGKAFYMPKTQAKRCLAELRKECGEEFFKRISQMAEAFLALV